MSGHVHHYQVSIDWTGNLGSGTSQYRAYSRNHEIAAPGKATILGSSDPAFLGDATRWNPEELLLASLSTCHKLWYLHLAADAGIVVTNYADRPEGFMEEDPDGSGRFIRAVLHPTVTVQARADLELAAELHHAAHEMCFVANSVNFPVECVPEIVPARSNANADPI